MISHKMARYVEEHLSNVPPLPCVFEVGQVVTFTNDNGIKFDNLTIIGFSKPGDILHGRHIHLDKESYWFPVHENSLKVKVDSPYVFA